MIPKTIKVSQFRKDLPSFLKKARLEPVVVQDTENQYVVITVSEFNRMNSFEEMFKEEDPEGKYQEKFVKKMQNLLKNKNDIEKNVKSFKDLL